MARKRACFIFFDAVSLKKVPTFHSVSLCNNSVYLTSASQKINATLQLQLKIEIIYTDVKNGDFPKPQSKTSVPVHPPSRPSGRPPPTLTADQLLRAWRKVADSASVHLGATGYGPRRDTVPGCANQDGVPWLHMPMHFQIFAGGFYSESIFWNPSCQAFHNGFLA